jgi:hypothetical protein
MKTVLEVILNYETSLDYEISFMFGERIQLV